MAILFCGVMWIVLSAMLARPGFFNYCGWRAVADKSKSPEQIYLAAKPKLLSQGWLVWSLLTMALACTGLWLLSPDRTAFLSEAIGTALLLTAVGLLIGFHIVHAGRIWNDVAGTA